MSRSKRLHIVLELAQTAENKAAKAYEMAQGLYDEDVNKLQDLCAYYEEYESDFSKPSVALRAEHIARQRGFLMQLTEAKKQQEKIIEQRRSILDSKKGVWQKAHLKRRAMSDLIDRIKLDEDKLLSKKEEKMLDEWFIQSAPTRSQNSILH